MSSAKASFHSLFSSPPPSSSARFARPPPLDAPTAPLPALPSSSASSSDRKAPVARERDAVVRPEISPRVSSVSFLVPPSSRPLPGKRDETAEQVREGDQDDEQDEGEYRRRTAIFKGFRATPSPTPQAPPSAGSTAGSQRTSLTPSTFSAATTIRPGAGGAPSDGRDGSARLDETETGEGQGEGDSPASVGVIWKRPDSSSTTSSSSDGDASLASAESTLSQVTGGDDSPLSLFAPESVVSSPRESISPTISFPVSPPVSQAPSSVGTARSPASLSGVPTSVDGSPNPVFAAVLTSSPLPPAPTSSSPSTDAGSPPGQDKAKTGGRFAVDKDLAQRFASFVFDEQGGIAKPERRRRAQQESATAPAPAEPISPLNVTTFAGVHVEDGGQQKPPATIVPEKRSTRYSTASTSTGLGVIVDSFPDASQRTASPAQPAPSGGIGSAPTHHTRLTQQPASKSNPPPTRSILRRSTHEGQQNRISFLDDSGSSPEVSRSSFQSTGSRGSDVNKQHLSLSSASTSSQYKSTRPTSMSSSTSSQPRMHGPHHQQQGSSSQSAMGYVYNSTAPISEPRSSTQLLHPHAQADDDTVRTRKQSTKKAEDEGRRTLDAFLGTGEFSSKKYSSSKSKEKPSKGKEPEGTMRGEEKKRSRKREFLDLAFGGGRSRPSDSPPLSAPVSSSGRSHAPPPPVPLPPTPVSSTISPMSRDEEDLCPVCLEPLAMRMMGEKPHINPVCGHRLHSSCFEAVYGPVVRGKEKNASLGLCGVCRRDMKLGDDPDSPMSKGGKQSKFAAMAGLPGHDPVSGPFDSHKVRSISRKTLQDNSAGQSLHDPEEDDVIEDRVPTPRRHLAHRNSADTLQAAGSLGSGQQTRTGSFSNQARPRTVTESDVAQPRITVTSEHQTLSRSSNPDKKQNVTCLVTFEMPSRHPGPRPFDRQSSTPVQSPPPPPSRNLWASPAPQNHTTSVDRSPQTDSARSPSPDWAGRTSPLPEERSGSTQPSGPLQAVVDDLRRRMVDWKGHDPDTFGALQLYDLLAVRRTHNAREFLIFLFEETLLCVDEDAKHLPASPNDKAPLRLRGRVYVRHITHVEETSPSPSELTLTIEMEQTELDAFVMQFKDRSSLEVWKFKIQQMADRKRSNRAKRDDTLGRNKGTRGSVMSGGTDTTRNTQTTSSDGGHSSSAFTHHTRTTMTTVPSLASVGEEVEAQYANLPAQPMAQSRDIYQHHSPSVSVGSLSAPRELPPIDLMIIISVPVQSHSAPTSFTLKLRLIRQALDFIVNALAPRARLSLVTYSVGEGSRGQLRKTPFLAVGKDDGRRRLQAVIDSIGEPPSKALGYIDPSDEKVSVVSAVNLALDIVLQRKQKNPLSGILLINDARDLSSKPQMSLVMARAEAANVPIHTIGWGKGHDPSSLWQLSHHTGGTYTFAPDWYSLKDCLAGCVGGMLSVAVTNFRVHVSVPERRWFRIRKVAGIQSVVLSSDGKDADIDLGELRYGEKREVLVEMEMLPVPHTGEGSPRHRGQAVSTATDEFFYKKTGINPMTLDDMSGNFYDAELEEFVDEVPLFEVDASYRDPAASKNVSRLPYPVLLTVTVTPPSQSGQRSPSAAADPTIVRRRIEVLTSDALTRALLLVSRNNNSQAQRLLSETGRIISALMGNFAPGYNQPSAYRRDPKASNLAYSVLAGCGEDVAIVQQGIENRQTFDQIEKNFAAQQAVVLREQRAWTGRTATERSFWRADNSIYLAHQSARWVANG